MADEQKYLSFGRYLRSIRLENRIGLEEVAKETKISIDILTHIENQAHDKLPAKVFVQGFIRAYAKAIGADGDEAIKRYLENLGEREKAQKAESEFKITGIRFWLRLASILGVILIVIFGSIYIADLFNSQKSSNVSNSEQSQPNDHQKTTYKIAKPEVQEPKTEQPVVNHKELKVVALDETWIKVIIDGDHPQKFNLKAGDKLAFKGKQSFNLLIGNSKAVQLNLDGKPVFVPGKSGQVVQMELP